jgi:hypothetical protein
MAKINWSLIVSLCVLAFVVLTFVFVDWPSRNDAENLKNEVHNLSDTFSNEIDSIRGDIDEIKTQNEDYSNELINATKSLAKEKTNLELNFVYESNISTDDINFLCGLSFVDCIKSKEIEDYGGIGNGTYSYARIEILNPEKVIQKEVRLSLNCGQDSIFLRGLTYPPTIVEDFSSIAGFRWEIRFNEVSPEDKIVINFPYVLYKGNGTCNIDYYSETSDKKTQIYTVYSSRIERIY